MAPQARQTLAKDDYHKGKMVNGQVVPRQAPFQNYFGVIPVLQPEAPALPARSSKPVKSIDLAEGGGSGVRKIILANLNSERSNRRTSIERLAQKIISQTKGPAFLVGPGSARHGGEGPAIKKPQHPLSRATQ